MVAAAAAEDTDMRNLKPLGEASRVKGVNLLDSQWAWLDDMFLEHRVGRSELVRRAVAMLQQAVEQHGPEGPILGKV